MSLNYSKAAELLSICTARGERISEVALLREIEASQKPREEIVGRMEDYFRIMRESIRTGLKIQTSSPSGLSGGDARKLLAYSDSVSPLLGQQFARTMAFGFAVLETNACLGRSWRPRQQDPPGLCQRACCPFRRHIRSMMPPPPGRSSPQPASGM